MKFVPLVSGLRQKSVAIMIATIMSSGGELGISKRGPGNPFRASIKLMPLA
jgi:hypothetical protein